MDQLKISVLFWEDRSKEGTEHDEVVDEVAGALSEGGHKVSLDRNNATIYANFWTTLMTNDPTWCSISARGLLITMSMKCMLRLFWPCLASLLRELARQGWP